ncbi:hypothetical protein BGX24_004013 [Mortierella sp. AD032]|nr:hypothetical protein BGX24_004013 [Mortierella sp. AD032]
MRILEDPEIVISDLHRQLNEHFKLRPPVGQSTISNYVNHSIGCTLKLIHPEPVDYNSPDRIEKLGRALHGVRPVKAVETKRGFNHYLLVAVDKNGLIASESTPQPDRMGVQHQCPCKKRRLQKYNLAGHIRRSLQRNVTEANATSWLHEVKRNFLLAIMAENEDDDLDESDGEEILMEKGSSSDSSDSSTSGSDIDKQGDGGEEVMSEEEQEKDEQMEELEEDEKMQEEEVEEEDVQQIPSTKSRYILRSSGTRLQA